MADFRISISRGHRFLARLVVSAIVVLAFCGVEAPLALAEIIINYEIFGSTAFDPSNKDYFGWNKGTTTGTGISVGSVDDPASGGGAAWNVSDNSSGLSPIYFYGLGANDRSRVDQEGWRQ
jgi:hypothetical protein